MKQHVSGPTHPNIGRPDPVKLVIKMGKFKNIDIDIFCQDIFYCHNYIYFNLLISTH